MNTNNIQNQRYNSTNKNSSYKTNPLENVSKQTKSGPIMIVSSAILLLLLIFILQLLYNKGQLFAYNGLNQSQSSVVNEILLSLSIVFAVFFILILFFPSIKEMSGFFTGISSSFVCIIYTFFLLYCFYTIPTTTMNTYASMLVPFFLFLTTFVFGASLITSFSSSSKNKSPMYDQINTMILFFCFLVTGILFYTVDPGNYISSHFSSLSLISLLIGIFGFVYLLILFIVPSENSTTNINIQSIFKSMTLNVSTVIGIAVFLLFSILIIVGIAQFPGGFFSEANLWSSLTITLLLSLVFSILSIFAIYSFSSGTTTNEAKMGLFKKSLLTVFTIVISALIITWLVYGIEGLTGTSGIVSFLLNTFLVMILLAFIYKSLNPKLPQHQQQHHSNRDNFGSLFFKILFYIPCIFSNGLDNLVYLFTDKDSVDQISSIVLIILFIFLFYFLTNLPKSIASTPLFNSNNRNQTILLTNPVPLNTKTTIGSYEELNRYSPPKPNTLQQHNYQYAISFWFNIEAEPNQSAYNEYKSIMNYGNKPDVLYRYADNSLLVTMERNGWRENVVTTNSSSNTNSSNNPLVLKKMDEYENDGIYKNSLILYRREKIQLQKWNNIVLNYANGTLDIFYNNELVKSAVGLVPYMTLDSLTVGSDDGVQGNIRDVVYYNKSLTLDSVHELGESRP